MIANKANIGCGYNIINEEGWLNIDKESRGPGENIRVWDITTPPDNSDPELDFTERFDFILVNHVLCTMNPWLVHKALINLHRCLKPGGTLQVIDMDLFKIIDAYDDGRYEDIPIEEGTPDEKLCNAISGLGTRDSLFTKKRLEEVLEEAGFRTIHHLDESSYDTRSKESVIVEAVK